ncbi:hypothetical protein ACMC5R_00385 [Deferribacteres bacterium DY0037]|nr:hypothetical protein [Denitrovibrio acetiphilus]
MNKGIPMGNVFIFERHIQKFSGKDNPDCCLDSAFAKNKLTRLNSR